MRKIIISSVIIGASLMLACGDSTSVNTAPNNTKAPSNAVNSGTNSPATNVNDLPPGTTVKPVGETSNNAPTLAPVVQAYYEALKKKDDAGLTAVMSQEFVARTMKRAKEDKAKSLADYMAGIESIPEKPVEVRNEVIQGDKAVAEIKGGSYLNWTKFAFINEGGKWKFTGGSPEIDAVKNSR